LSCDLLEVDTAFGAGLDSFLDFIRIATFGHYDMRLIIVALFEYIGSDIDAIATSGT
jgi:hypothetical protein